MYQNGIFQTLLNFLTGQLKHPNGQFKYGIESSLRQKYLVYSKHNKTTFEPKSASKASGIFDWNEVIRKGNL